MASLIGFDIATHEGILVPGGSYGNMMGLLLARAQRFPHVRTKGWGCEDRPVILTSDQAHYSVRKAAIVLGCGLDAVVAVEVSCCRLTLAKICIDARI